MGVGDFRWLSDLHMLESQYCLLIHFFLDFGWERMFFFFVVCFPPFSCFNFIIFRVELVGWFIKK